MGQVLRQRSGTNQSLLVDGGDHDDAGWKSRRQRDRKRVLALIGVILVAVFVFLLFVVHFYGIRSSPTTKFHGQLFGNMFSGKKKTVELADHPPQVVAKLRHAVMMDAGSTGSRVLVFTFQTSPDDNRLVLLDEFFKEVKPGISSYTDDPEKAAESIKGLMDDAKKIVPAELWPETTVSLKATAGLRLLPPEVAENLLNAIRDVFVSSGFLVRSDAVSIIDGKSEGFFLWTTINFLLGKTSDLNESVIVTDLGGASAQLAMVPLDPETVRDVVPEDVSTVSVFGQTVKFYIHSYLGMGLMAMRLSILRVTNRTSDEESSLFLCPYISPHSNFIWEFQGSEYTIRGVKKAGSHAGPNHELTELIKHVGMRRVDELKYRTLFAVSYFYDLAVDAGLIVASLGGSVSVGDYCRSARKVCENASTERPFACIDVTYICTLFRDGFGLPEDKVINLKKKIDGHETSWALGAAIVDLHKKRAP